MDLPRYIPCPHAGSIITTHVKTPSTKKTMTGADDDGS
jgi:hypothetical protein